MKLLNWIFPASPLNCFRVSPLPFLVHTLDSQQIPPRKVTEVRPEFFLIPFLQHLQVYRNRPGEVLYVVPVPLAVALEFGERKIVRVEGE